MWNEVSQSVRVGAAERAETRAGAPSAAKRVLDVVASLVVLAVCLPLFVLIAVAIKLDSRGPVFFCQRRVGRGGKIFGMLKFRSMVVDAERVQAALLRHTRQAGATFKMRNDPRVTRVGRILRRTSLDEFPQFLNVLRGQMSLVGPRPLPARHVGDWNGGAVGVSEQAVSDWLVQRHSVRPGLTGLWQVRGRSLLPLRQWIECDLEYVQEASPWLDLAILARTPLVVLTGRGAI